MKKNNFVSKTLLSVLALMMAAAVIFVSGAVYTPGRFATAAGPMLLKGDMDNDGKITAQDARTVLRTAVELDPVQYITVDDLYGSETSTDKIYNVGETWTVPGKFSITVNSVNEVKTTSGHAQEISIDIFAENIGVSNGLLIKNNPPQYSFNDGITGVYDEDSLIGEEVGYHKDIGIISPGKKGRGKLNWTFDSKVKTVTIEFCVQEEYKATFKVDVTPYREAEKDPETEAVLEPISLPHTFSVYNYSDKLLTKFTVTELTYEYSGTMLTLNLTGEKIYDSEGIGYSQQSKIGYKLYDSEGYVVASGTILTEALKTGDKIKNVKGYIHGIAPGEYRLELLDIKPS